MLEYFDDRELKTAEYIPITYTDNEETGQQTPVEGTAVEYTGLFWDRSEAARYFGQQINSDVSSYFVVEDIGSISKSGIIRFNGVDYAIETIGNIAYMDELYPIGLRIHE